MGLYIGEDLYFLSSIVVEFFVLYIGIVSKVIYVFGVVIVEDNNLFCFIVVSGVVFIVYIVCEVVGVFMVL